MSNTTNKEYLLSPEEATFFLIFTSMQSVIGSTANAIEIIFLWSKRHRYQATSDYLTLNLALADFVALTTYVPWRAYILSLREATGDFKYYTSLFVVCIFCTGNAVLLIAVDRFFAVMCPLRYKVLITGKVLWFSITISWITAFLLGVGHGVSYKLKIHSEYELFLCALSFGQLLIISVVYIMVFKSARKQAVFISEQAKHFTNYKRNHCFIWKSVLTTFCIICLFYGTFLPYSVYRIISTVDESLSKTAKRITWRRIMAFTFLNSCINPFIYFITMKKFRLNLKRFLGMKQ